MLDGGFHRLTDHLDDAAAGGIQAVLGEPVLTERQIAGNVRLVGDAGGSTADGAAGEELNWSVPGAEYGGARQFALQGADVRCLRGLEQRAGRHAELGGDLFAGWESEFRRCR